MRSHLVIYDYFALSLYLAALVVIGIYFSRREKSTDDFFLAGKRIPWWASGISIFGTQLSAITFMAIPAKAFTTDWVYFLNNMCIVLITPVVVHFYLPFYRRLNVTTAYEYLEKRFGLLTRLFGSMTFMLFQLGRMAIVLYLPAIALSTVTGINTIYCILIMGVLCTVYTYLGGIEAVIWTDVLQVIVLIGGALAALIVICIQVNGGLSEIISVAQEHGKFHMFNWTWDWTTTAIWVVVFGNLFSNLVPYTSDQTVVQRYLTTKNEKAAGRSIWTNAVITIPSSVLFFGIGTALYVFYMKRPGLLNPTLQTDAIFPWFIVQQLPVGISGLVIAGLFAASMSSLDSSMNSVATSLVTDFYRRFKQTGSEIHYLKIARLSIVLIGLFATGTAVLLATCEIESMWDLFLKILGLFGGALAGVFALGIFTRKTHEKGVVFGIVLSIAVLVVVQCCTKIHFFLYAAVGIFTCVGMGYVASLIIPGVQKNLKGLTVYQKTKIKV